MAELNPYNNRFEYKYVIPVYTRDEIIADLKPFCRLDANSDSATGDYFISSLYYDTDDLRAFNEKIDGENLRKKIRLRCYTTMKAGHCFLEIKAKESNIIFKRRVLLPIDLAKEILALRIDLEDPRVQVLKPKEQETIEEVIFHARNFNLRPMAVVSYHRRAFDCAFEKRLRLTFDSMIRVQASDLTPDSKYLPDKFGLDPKLCVFELKFNGQAPEWIIRILQNHNCSIQKLSKYCAGVANSYTHYVSV